MILYGALRLAGLVRWLPPRLAYWVGDGVATVLWWGWRGPRTTAIENLVRITGERTTATRAARSAFRNYARFCIDFLRAPSLRPEVVRTKVDFDQWAAFDAAVAAGTGVLLISMHVGNWDLGGAALAARGYPLRVVADPWGTARTNARIVQARQRRGMTVIPVDQAARGIVRALRRQEVVALLIDTPVAAGGVEVTFFGERTVVPAGPARIALRTGARVIPVVMVRARPTSDQLIALVDFDVRVERSGDTARDVQALTQRIIHAHERFLRAYPDQWSIFRRLWPAPPRPRATVRVRAARDALDALDQQR